MVKPKEITFKKTINGNDITGTITMLNGWIEISITTIDKDGLETWTNSTICSCSDNTIENVFEIIKTAKLE